MNLPPPDEKPPRPLRWPWIALALAMIWIALVRIPLVLNAGSHLDSDLAVDGLTLQDAVRGHWRWHYPGTPHMGIGPVLLSWPQAKWFGVNPQTLVSGGVVAYELVVIAIFGLAWRASGPRVAAWSLIPLAFASTGSVWLSGRITGGHLLTVAWFAWSLSLLHGCLRRGGMLRAAALGLACGVGIYLDRMFLVPAAAIVAAAAGTWLARGGSWSGVRAAIAFLPAFVGGYLPHVQGLQADPHDAYQEQFQSIFRAPGIAGIPGRWDWAAGKTLALAHGRLLALDCLPRLIAGHRLPGLEAEPHPSTLENRPAPRKTAGFHPLSAAVAGPALVFFGAAAVALLRAPAGGVETADLAVRWAILAVSAVTLVGFVVNRNIFNSDNYRYLVLLLVPWAIGFGLFTDALWRRGRSGRLAAVTIATSLAILMTLDTARWYAGFGWVDRSGMPVRRKVKDPALTWLVAHPEVDAVFGSYWDVYRLAFLTGGRVRGVPYPIFPDRFPEWSSDLPGHRPRILIARRTSEGEFYRQTALREGAREFLRNRDVAVYDWSQ